MSGPNSSATNSHTEALCSIWLEGLNVFWYQGTQTSRPASLAQRIRREGEKRPFFFMCDVNCVGTRTCHPQQWLQRDWKGRWKHRKRGHLKKVMGSSPRKPNFSKLHRLFCSFCKSLQIDWSWTQDFYSKRYLEKNQNQYFEYFHM